MGRILLSALSADLREEWLSHTVLEPRTERTIVSADALRAELDIVAEQRWSLVEEELEPGLRSLAVPVRDRDGNILAALNVATFSHAHSREYLMEKYLPDLRAARSEEHTSELQSLMRTSYAVFCLKKKKHTTT